MDKFRNGGIIFAAIAQHREDLMTAPYIGQIFAFAGNFAPRGYMLCQGQTLAIQQYAALFSILGTTYGGNGTSTFQLPNLQGRSIVGYGTSQSGTPYVLGETGGVTSVTLTQAQMPLHTHTVTAQGDAGIIGSPAGAYIAQNGAGRNAVSQFTNSAPNPSVTMAAGMIGQTGGSTPVSIQSPFQVLNYIIAIQGVFPSRN